MDKVITLVSRHKSFLLAFNALILALTLGKLAFSPREWTAEAQLILPNNTGNLDADLGTLGSLKSSNVSFSNTLDPLKAQQSILFSNPVMSNVLEDDPEREKFERLRKYKELFNIAIAEKSNTLELAVVGSDPELANQRTENWISAYQQRLNELRRQDRSNREIFNEKQIEDARDRLAKADRRLAEWRKSSRLVDSDAQTQNLVSTIGELTSLQKQAQAKAKANEQQIATISARLSLTPKQAVTSLGLGEDKDYQFIKNELVQVETDLSTLRAKFTDSEPRIQNLLAEKAELEKKLQQHLNKTGANKVDKIDSSVSSDAEGRAKLIQQLVLLESEAKANRTQAQQYTQQIEEINSRLELIPETQAELLQLQREKNIAEGVYQGLVAQVQQVSINSFNSYPNIQVIDPPSTDSKPSSPNKKVILASWLLASALGSTAIIFLRESQNPLLEPKDLMQNQFGIVVCIPKYKPLAAPFDLPYPVRVEFEKLASAISQQKLEDNRFLIASSLSGEGKTTTTIGLAKALADLGYQVLMVDADYRRGELTQRFGFNPTEKQEYPFVVHSNIDLLTAIPQRGNVAALVTKGYFEEQIIEAETTNKYDFILIDSSPISLTSETVMMSSLIKNTLFVIRPGVSQRDIVQSSLSQLKHHGVEPLSLIVNEVKTNNPQLTDSPYYYFNAIAGSQEDNPEQNNNPNENNGNGKGQMVIR